LLKQLSKLINPTIQLPNNVILSYVDSTRNLGVIFDTTIILSCILWLSHNMQLSIMLVYVSRLTLTLRPSQGLPGGFNIIEVSN